MYRKTCFSIEKEHTPPGCIEKFVCLFETKTNSFVYEKCFVFYTKHVFLYIRVGVCSFSIEETGFSIHPGGGDFYGFPVDVLWISYGSPNKHIILVEIFDYLQLCSCATTNGDVLFLS